jgi:hypothetical protein
LAGRKDKSRRMGGLTSKELRQFILWGVVMLLAFLVIVYLTIPHQTIYIPR